MTDDTDTDDDSADAGERRGYVSPDDYERDPERYDLAHNHRRAVAMRGRR